MKAVIASDIHGNSLYMDALEQIILRENPDKLILLGDYGFHNPDIRNTLNKYSDIIYACQGNCDTDEYKEEINFNYLRDSFETNLDDIRFFCTHGHLLYTKEMIEQSKDKYILQGHTHVYKIYGRTINPGSVGRPRENPEHTCLVYKNKTFYLIDLDNDNIIDKRVLENKKNDKNIKNIV